MTQFEKFMKSNKAIMEEIAELSERKKALDLLLQSRRSTLYKRMLTNKIKSADSEFGRFNVIEGHDSTKFNSARFKKDYPKLSDQYTEPYFKDGYLTFTSIKEDRK